MKLSRYGKHPNPTKDGFFLLRPRKHIFASKEDSRKSWEEENKRIALEYMKMTLPMESELQGPPDQKILSLIARKIYRSTRQRIQLL